MDNDGLIEKVYSLEGDVRVIKTTQEQQAKDIKEIKDMLRDMQKDKQDDIKWVKRQFLSIGIGIVMTILALGFGCYSIQQVNQAKQIVLQYQK